MKHLFIVNPVAGGKDRHEYVAEQARLALEGSADAYEVYITTAPMDACAKIKAEAASGEELRVYACGGDGTLNECVNGAVGHDNVAVTHFPCGTGNDFIKMFGEEKDRFFDLSDLVRGEVRPLDVMECCGRYAVNICSVGATHQTAGAAYCASKGAVLAATKNTAFMYMEEGIRCNALSPGGVVTDIPLVMPPADEFGFGRTSKLLEFSGELAMPEDLADAILFLASDQSRYVNGEELKCDGGWTCF